MMFCKEKQRNAQVRKHVWQLSENTSVEINAPGFTSEIRINIRGGKHMFGNHTSGLFTSF